MKVCDRKRRTIQVYEREPFAIILDSNPSTGFRWIAQFNPNFIQEIDRKFELKGEGIGSGGTEKFVFKARKSGECEITMLYKRSWEEIFAKKEVFRLQILGGWGSNLECAEKVP